MIYRHRLAVDLVGIYCLRRATIEGRFSSFYSLSQDFPVCLRKLAGEPDRAFAVGRQTRGLRIHPRQGGEIDVATGQNDSRAPAGDVHFAFTNGGVGDGGGRLDHDA